MKKFLNYTQWQDTADTLHMLLQITGKIKLERCYKRPEWSHIRQYLTIDGITTGIIPGDESPFDILINLRKHYMRLRNAKGKEICIPLEDEVSISKYYKQISLALKYIGSPTHIFVRPQEFYDPIDFDKDDKHASYNKYAVNLFLDNLHFAYLALKEFMSPFRGKVDCPAYYFGTMDLSGIIYSGEPEAFKTTDKISLHAFDEKNCEFGFWPGDPIFHKPSFYVMPYPFISSMDIYGNMLRPDKAVFKPEKKEFFLTLEDAFRYDHPTEAVIEFFKSSFAILQQLKKWNNPVIYSYVSHAHLIANEISDHVYELLLNAISKFPQEERFYKFLGIYFINKKIYFKALEAFEKALENSSSLSRTIEYYYDAIFTCHKLGLKNKINDIIKKCDIMIVQPHLQLSDNDMYILGYIYFYGEDFIKAEKYYKKCLSKNKKEYSL